MTATAYSVSPPPHHFTPAVLVRALADFGVLTGSRGKARLRKLRWTRLKCPQTQPNRNSSRICDEFAAERPLPVFRARPPSPASARLLWRFATFQAMAMRASFNRP